MMMGFRLQDAPLPIVLKSGGSWSAGELFESLQRRVGLAAAADAVMQVKNKCLMLCAASTLQRTSWSQSHDASTHCATRAPLHAAHLCPCREHRCSSYTQAIITCSMAISSTIRA
jgi:hypothetical protein